MFPAHADATVPGPLPVVGEGFVVLGVERAGGGEHDGGVQVGDDPRHGAGCRDAGLSPLVACLEG